MKFPAYWSKATAVEKDADGNPIEMTRWNWSDVSFDDAKKKAHAAAQAACRAFTNRSFDFERYPYGQNRPLREEILQEFARDDGTLYAAITQNAYGCLVLNTVGVLFLDVDFPPVMPGETIKHFFSRWFGKLRVPPQVQKESTTLANLQAFLRSQSDWSARLYRTCAGLRVLATHRLFEPVADATQNLFAASGADPLYARLCKSQASFRARLTPKPWRSGHDANHVAWPHESEADTRKFAAWKAEYIGCQTNYATCQFLESIGNAAVHPEAATIVEIHDRATRAAEPLELA